MKIRNLVLRNWKNFVSVDAVIGDRLFPVGPNASGKSSSLDQFWLLFDAAGCLGFLVEGAA